MTAFSQNGTEGDAPVVLITGTSSGIGSACASHLARSGYRVFGASRQHQCGFKNFVPVVMDVTDDDAVREGVDRILAETNRIDALINNAGIGIAGAIEDCSIDEVKTQFETNFFGTFRVCKAVLPGMRTRRSGTIINMSSIAGIVGLPYQAIYSASKFAIEGMTEGLRMEVRSFGIRVVLIEPGDFKTNFTLNRVKTRASQHESPYRDQFHRTLSIMEEDELNGPAPDAIAAQVARILQMRSPRPRYTAGSRLQQLAPAAKKLLPTSLFYRMLGAIYEIE